jgi:hypothetical protein
VNAPPLPAVIPEGRRNDVLASAAGTMRHHGADQEAIYAALRIENAARCQPPLPDREVRKIAASVAHYAPSPTWPSDVQADAKLRALNATYAVIQVGGTVAILQERPGRKFELMTPAAFRLLLQNQRITRTNADGQEATKPLAEVWLGWDERRLYDDIVFKPGQTDVGNDYNLWRGWGVEPSREGTCNLLLRHLRVAVCRGNEEHYEWLLDWLADLVQHPMRKPGSAVALRGPQGSGKSLVGAAMKPILGETQLVVEKAGQVVGRFNGHLANCLLLQAEEAFWGGNREARGVLKHLVTGDTLPIERKGIDTVTMPNYTRLLITSNEEWVWPAEVGDRRIVVFQVEKAGQRDADYFDALHGELAAGGYAHLLYLLQRRPIDEHRLLKRLPVTMALRDQVVLTASPEDAWLRELLLDGMLPSGSRIDANGYAHVPVKALHAHYVARAGRFPKNEEQLGVFLKKHLPRPKDVEYRGEHRLWLNGQHVRSRPRVIRPLGECRRRYERLGRGTPQKWPTRRAWRVAE